MIYAKVVKKLTWIQLKREISTNLNACKVQQLNNRRTSLLTDINEANQYERLEKIFLPLKGIPYEDQLKYKESILHRYTNELMITLAYDAIISDKMRDYLFNLPHVNLFSEIFAITPLKNLEKYQTNLSIFVGKSFDGLNKCVGSKINCNTEQVNDVKMHQVYSIPMHHLNNITDDHKLILKHFQEFLHSYNFHDDTSWSPSELRRNLNNENMFIVSYCPRGKASAVYLFANSCTRSFHNFTSNIKSEFDIVEEKLNDYFVNGPGKECKIDSLYLKLQDKYSPPGIPKYSQYKLISGLEFLSQNGIDYSPYILYPRNMEAYLNLQHAILKYLKNNKDEIDVLFDFNSEDGIIGVLAQDLYKKYIFFNESNLSIRNTRLNLANNGIDNNRIEYRRGIHTIKFVIDDLIKKFGETVRLSVVIHDSMDHLEREVKVSMFDVISKLRSTEQVKQILYVTHKTSSASSQLSLYNLSCGERASENIKGSPFMPLSASQIDTAPDTHLCSSVFHYKRE